MNRCRLLGFTIGFFLALLIRFCRDQLTHDNPAQNSPTEAAIAPSPSLTREVEKSPVEKLPPDSQSGVSRSSRTSPVARDRLPTDEIAVTKAEQQRLIGFADSLEQNAKRLGNAMIALLREMDVNRMIQDGKSVGRRELIAEIEATAPIPDVPYGPKLGLVPIQ